MHFWTLIYKQFKTHIRILVTTFLNLHKGISKHHLSNSDHTSPSRISSEVTNFFKIRSVGYPWERRNNIFELIFIFDFNNDILNQVNFFVFNNFNVPITNCPIRSSESVENAIRAKSAFSLPSLCFINHLALDNTIMQQFF